MRTGAQIVLFGLVVLLLVVGAVALPTEAADHLDAPGLTSPDGDGRLDITDIYAFQSPANSADTVFVVGVDPLAGVLSPTTFHPLASYDIKIDTTGDAKEEITYKITFSPANSAGVQDVLLRRVPAQGGGAVLARGTTGQDIPVAGGGTLRVGTFDDPFFFDLLAFLGSGGRSFCDGGETDFFAGLNVAALVLEVPSAAFGTNSIGVWARTELGGQQIDRMGRPAINTVFIPSSAKNAYNAGKPKHDARDFSQFLGSFAPVLLPDILTIDTSSSAGFLNGRRLADDVIDTELQIITGNPAASDCVDANDVPFQATFPYLAPAH